MLRISLARHQCKTNIQEIKVRTTEIKIVGTISIKNVKKKFYRV